MIIPSEWRRLTVSAAILASLGGSFIAVRDYLAGLTLSHYDARGHLVVARRIFDSITPGWQQIGAVWLPLPHLLNAIPVQLEPLYRSGASAVAFSVAAFALATAAITWIVATTTGSTLAAVAAAAIFAFNPNVLYLQATPMTEPLLLGLTLAAVALLIDWCSRQSLKSGVASRKSQVSNLESDGSILAVDTSDFRLQTSDFSTPPVGLVGSAFALACLTRYEAWPITGCALAAAFWVLWRTGSTPGAAAGRVAAVAIYPAAAVVAFVVFSRIVIGEWFVSSGFFVPENNARGHPLIALAQIGWGVRQVSGPLLFGAGMVGLLSIAGLVLRDRRRALLAIPIALVASAAVPWVAYLEGHPYRIRYVIPLIAAEAVIAGIAAGLAERFRVAVAIILIFMAGVELRPLTFDAPIIVEAQWDRPNQTKRQAIADYLRAEYGGETVMASMGSLGHYMQDLSASGFHLSDFLHEGNGDIWLNALGTPRPYAGWILIEEQAEGGDVLADIARKNPGFLDGYSRVAEGAGVALYRRTWAPGATSSPP